MLSNKFPKMSDLDWIALDISHRIKSLQFEIEKSHEREAEYGKSTDEDSLRVSLHGQIEGLRDAQAIVDDRK